MDISQFERMVSDKSADLITDVEPSIDMLTLEVVPADLSDFSLLLRDDKDLRFTTLVDICVVDYSDYGVSYWRQGKEAASGYARATVSQGDASESTWERERFCAVYHLLSLHLNKRIRLKVYIPEGASVPSVTSVWPSANWYEREAYDLFGVVFSGHPNLSRLLTDYGFKGHPFRKDFPLIGEVEMRYDAEQEACIYEPVSIQPRILVPKVIRTDSRYCHVDDEEGSPNV
jgi:NADH-quinone oxidoreductase subunit C